MTAPPFDQWYVLFLIVRGARREDLGTRLDGKSWAEVLIGRGWMSQGGRLTDLGRAAFDAGYEAHARRQDRRGAA